MRKNVDAYPGEERVIRKFLFLPRCLPVGREGVNRQWRWLCFSYIRCVYHWNAGWSLGEDDWVELYFVE